MIDLQVIWVDFSYSLYNVKARNPPINAAAAPTTTVSDLVDIDFKIAIVDMTSQLLEFS